MRAVESVLVEVAEHPGAERIVERLFRPLLSELELIAPNKVSSLGRIAHNFRSCSDAALDDALASLLKERNAKVKPSDIRKALETARRAEESARRDEERDARERQAEADAAAVLEAIAAAPADLDVLARLLVTTVEPLKARLPEGRYREITWAFSRCVDSTGASQEQVGEAFYGSRRPQVSVCIRDEEGELMEVAFTGRLGQPPQHRTSANGKRWVSFSLAVGSGEGTEWVKVAVFEPLADELPSDLGKGERLYVEGKLKLNRWEDAKGPRSGLQVAASTVLVLDRIGRRRKPARRKAGEATAQDHPGAIPPERPDENHELPRCRRLRPTASVSRLMTRSHLTRTRNDAMSIETTVPASAHNAYFRKSEPSSAGLGPMISQPEAMQ